MKTYTVKKGRHYCLHLPRIHLGVKSLLLTTKFHESCKYKFNTVDDLDINKLGGVSWGLHHNNSFRIGWNYNSELDLINLYSYWYNKGVRGYAPIGMCGVDETIELIVNFDRSSNRIIVGCENHKYQTNFDFKDVCKCGYFLGVYQGGNRTVDHDIQIDLSIKQLNSKYKLD